MYGYDDARAYVINSLFQDVRGPLWGEAQLLLGNGSVLARASGGLPDGISADGAVPIFALPSPEAVLAMIGSHRTYLIRVALYNGSSALGAVVSLLLWLHSRAQSRIGTAHNELIHNAAVSRDLLAEHGA